MADTIDFKGILEEALNLKDAANVPVSVSVYLDELAPEDVIACVRNSFASAASHARITLSYLGSSQAVPNASDDMAVIVAGLNEGVGKLAADLREAGVPVMVVTTMPEYVGSMAKSQGFEIPDGDLVAPVAATREDSPVGRVVGRLQEKSHAHDEDAIMGGNQQVAAPFREKMRRVEQEGEDVASQPAEDAGELFEPPSSGRGVGRIFSSLVGAAQKRVAAVQEAATQAQPAEQYKTVAERIAEVMPEGSCEPFALDEQLIATLRTRMGQWIISTCHEKRLALALAFPFVRRPLSLEFVNMTSVQNAGIGAVLFIPGADMPIMTANQAKMLLQIAAAYGQPMTVERVKELVAVVAGGFACRTVAREIVGIIPVGGFVVKAGIAYTATLGMGHAAIEYFENGGGASGFAGVVGKAKDAAVGAVSAAQQAAGVAEEPMVDTRTSAEKARDAAKVWGSRAKKAASSASSVAGPIACSALKTGFSSFVSGAGSMVSGVKR